MPAIASGKPSAATVPIARCVVTLHQVRNGTPIAAAPPPKRLATAPMRTPTAPSTRGPGSVRAGFGRKLNTICDVMNAANARKNTLRNTVGVKRATAAPASTPTSSPGVIARTTLQSTASWRSCTRKLANVPTIIAASDVPIARCMTKPGGKPCAAKTSASDETMMTPPPIPSSPEKNPTTTPIAR